MCAALELIDAGHEVTVLEARMRPGGRVADRQMPGVRIDDLRGQHVMAAERRTASLDVLPPEIVRRAKQRHRRIEQPDLCAEIEPRPTSGTISVGGVAAARES